MIGTETKTITKTKMYYDQRNIYRNGYRYRYRGRIDSWDYFKLIPMHMHMHMHMQEVQSSVPYGGYDGRTMYSQQEHYSTTRPHHNSDTSPRSIQENNIETKNNDYLWY